MITTRILQMVESVFGKDAKTVSKRSCQTVQIAVAGREKQLRERLATEPNLSDEEVLTIKTTLDEIAVLKRELADAIAWESSIESAPLPSAEQLRAIVREASLWCPDLSLDVNAIKPRIAELQTAFERDNAEMAKYFPHEAKRAFVAHNEKLAESIRSGSGVDEHEAWSLADFEDDFSRKLSGFKTAVKRHSVEAFELVKPHLANIADGIAGLAGQIEQAERNRAEVFLMPFVPSPILGLLRKAQLVIEKRIEEFNPAAGESPSAIASILG